MNLKAAVAGLSIALLAGCVTREDIRGLQTDLYSIQKGLELKSDTVQTNQADLGQDMQRLRESLTALQTELQDNLSRMKALSIRLDDLEGSMNARMDAQIELLSGSKFVEKPLPSTVFNLANSDFARGKDQEAMKGFEGYIKQFPKGEQVPEAKLRIAEILIRQKKESEAAQALDELVKAHPKSTIAPSALLRKAKLLESSGKNTQAVQTYQMILKTYPYSSEARAAQQATAEIQNRR
jgi:tol-pal system protein YbgF